MEHVGGYGVIIIIHSQQKYIWNVVIIYTHKKYETRLYITHTQLVSAILNITNTGKIQKLAFCGCH